MTPNKKKTPSTTPYEYISVYLAQSTTGLYYLIDADGSDLSMPDHGISAGSSQRLKTLFDMFGKDGWELVSFLPEASIENRSSAYLAVFKRRYTIKRIIDWKYDVWLPMQGFLLVAWMVLAPVLYFDPFSLQIDWLHVTGNDFLDFTFVLILGLFPLMAWIFCLLLGLRWIGGKIYDSMYENLEEHYLEKRQLKGINAFVTPREKNHFTDGIHVRVKLILLIIGFAIFGLIYLIEEARILGKI